MTATDNPKILSSTAIATTAMIMPTDRGARADTDPPLRAPDPPQHDAGCTQPYQRNRDEGVQPQIERTKIALMNMDPDSRQLNYVRACFQTGRGRVISAGSVALSFPETSGVSNGSQELSSPMRSN
jgi:hypothetical protein